MAEIQVSTWAEFVTACATSGADVVIAENTVWNMNEISPAGAPTVTVACNSINGSGSTIKNASVISQPLFNFTAAATVTRLNIADFTADTAVIAGTVNGAVNGTYLRIFSILILPEAILCPAGCSVDGKMTFRRISREEAKQKKELRTIDMTNIDPQTKYLPQKIHDYQLAIDVL